jgi:hypothetical protein
MVCPVRVQPMATSASPRLPIFRLPLNPKLGPRTRFALKPNNLLSCTGGEDGDLGARMEDNRVASKSPTLQSFQCPQQREHASHAVKRQLGAIGGLAAAVWREGATRVLAVHCRAFRGRRSRLQQGEAGARAYYILVHIYHDMPYALQLARPAVTALRIPRAFHTWPPVPSLADVRAERCAEYSY